jgi:hypothetical protein
MAVARAGYPVSPWLAGPSFSSRFITGACYIAIDMPFVTSLILNDLCEILIRFLWLPGAFGQYSFQKM